MAVGGADRIVLAAMTPADRAVLKYRRTPSSDLNASLLTPQANASGRKAYQASCRAQLPAVQLILSGRAVGTH